MYIRRHYVSHETMIDPKYNNRVLYYFSVIIWSRTTESYHQPNRSSGFLNTAEEALERALKVGLEELRIKLEKS